MRDQTGMVLETVAYGEHPEQFGHLRTPAQDQDRPLVVLIHGGFWRDQYRLDLMTPLAQDLAERGYASWNIEYRRVGPTGGGWQTTTDDVAAAIDHVSGRWSHLVVIGHSAGGHLALWNASRSPSLQSPSLTIGLAPVADVETANRLGVGRDATTNFLEGNVDEVPERYRHVQPRPDSFKGRVVLVHGDLDTNVPIEQSTALEEHVAAVHVLASVDHFMVIDPAHDSWQLVVEELSAVHRTT